MEGKKLTSHIEFQPPLCTPLEAHRWGQVVSETMVAIGEKSGDLFIWGEGVRLKTLLGLFLFGENKTQQTKQNISRQPPYVKKN